MEIRKPNYYDTFRCLAGACPDSCCKEWAVQIDDASARRYRTLPGPLGDALRQVMAEEGGDIILTLTADGRCPMWRHDGLCKIQAQLGEEALCHTCRQFPRLRHDYGSFSELGLELSCPEAARLILSGNPEWITENLPGGDEPEYEPEIMEVLLQSRNEFLTYLNSGKHSVGQTLAVLLLYGYGVQEALDGGVPACLAPDANLSTAQQLAAKGDIAAVLSFFRTLEMLTPAWKQRLQSPAPSPWTEDYRAIARYFINRYWLQAVSDYDLVGRVKLIIVSCLVIKSLGGDLLATAQLYSKEIENDADNIDSILDAAYTEPALADIGLLSLLLED